MALSGAMVRERLAEIFTHKGWPAHVSDCRDKAAYRVHRWGADVFEIPHRVVVQGAMECLRYYESLKAVDKTGIEKAADEIRARLFGEPNE